MKEAGNAGYEFFEEKRTREELYQISQAVCGYIREENIANLVLMDRGARPAYVGVVTYWDSNYPKEPKPSIYFVNPLGLTPDVQQTSSGLFIPSHDFDSETMQQARSQHEIDVAFQQTYHRLLSDKTTPTLLLDTCIHSGDTVKPVLETFKSVGMQDIRVGVMSNNRNNSGIIPDFIALPETPYYTCYPFLMDTIVTKTKDSVSSVRSNLPASEYEDLRLLRSEIRQIMQEKSQ